MSFLLESEDYYYVFLSTFGNPIQIFFFEDQLFKWITSYPIRMFSKNYSFLFVSTVSFLMVFVQELYKEFYFHFFQPSVSIRLGFGLEKRRNFKKSTDIVSAILLHNGIPIQFLLKLSNETKKTEKIKHFLFHSLSYLEVRCFEFCQGFFSNCFISIIIPLRRFRLNILNESVD